MSSSVLYEMRFEWPHSEPNNVFVTGTFDHWTRSIKLTKTNTGFVGSVRVPWAKKILYKFVVDGEWVCQAGQPTEKDLSGFINNVYFSPPNPGPLPAPEPAELATSAKSVPVHVESPAPEPISEPTASPTGSRKPIVIVPLNSAEHNTIGSVTTGIPPIPDFVLPPPPRARSVSPPPLREWSKPAEISSVQLNEVEAAPEPAIPTAPEVPVEEQKQEDVDSDISTPVPEVEVEEPVKEPVKELVTEEEEEEKVLFAEPEPSPEPVKIETPLLAEVEVEAKPIPASLPTPPATPSSKDVFPRSQSPSSSPSSSRFGTSASRKKRHSIFGKLKSIFHNDKDKVKK